MPNGPVHRRLNRIFSPLAVVAGAGMFWVSPMSVESGIFAVGIPFGWVIGSVVDPDLDIKKKNHGLWGQLYGEMASKLGGHRSHWTHMPVLATALRLLWFGFPWFGMAGLLCVIWPAVWPFIRALILGIALGMSMSDTLHLVADLL